MATTNKYISEISYEMGSQFEAINKDAIDRMATHIKDIGKLAPEDINAVEQMTRMGANVNAVNSEIRKQCGITAKRLDDIYMAEGKGEYAKMSKYYKAKGITQTEFAKNPTMTNYVKSVAVQTNNTFKNLSRTTNLSRKYRKVVDKAIHAVTTGVTDYETAVSSALLDAVENGTTVRYASGIERRLDSAVRMNVMDGMRQLSMGIKQRCGEEFGADGMMIDAHSLCAEDHIDIQGREFTMEEYETEVEGDDSIRDIGEFNCQHEATPCIIGVSENPYSEEDLDEMREYSEEPLEIDGKEMSRYQASQRMRRLETESRKAQEELYCAQKAGFEKMEAKAKKKLDRINKQYKDTHKTAGLKARKDRMDINRNPKYLNQRMKEFKRQMRKKR